MTDKILIADDSVDAADTTAMLLETDVRFEVKVVYDGIHAVQVARTFVPDLVLLDIDMPKMDGYETAGLLRSEQPADGCLILVALSGRNTQEDIDRARLAGFDHHLAKPVPGGMLCALVASFLEQRKS